MAHDTRARKTATQQITYFDFMQLLLVLSLSSPSKRHAVCPTGSSHLSEARFHELAVARNIGSEDRRYLPSDAFWGIVFSGSKGQWGYLQLSDGFLIKPHVT